MYMSDYKNKLWTDLSGFNGRVSYEVQWICMYDQYKIPGFNLAINHDQ